MAVKLPLSARISFQRTCARATRLDPIFRDFSSIKEKQEDQCAASRKPSCALDFTLLDTSDPNKGGQPTDRPNQIGNPFGAGTRTPQKWFDAAAFVHPPAGTDGLVSRNSLVGPRISNLDFSLFKNIPVTERQNVQFRAEFFNLFNHPNFDIPVNDFNSPAVGQIHDTRLANRQIQFALK